MYKVLVDTNIFVDFMFHRNPFYDDANKIFELIEKKKVKGFVTTSELMDMHYIFQKMSHSRKDANAAIGEVTKILNTISIIKEDIQNAVLDDAKDFEDIVIEKCAIRNNVEYIVTRNPKDFENMNISILQPKEFLEIICEDC